MTLVLLGGGGHASDVLSVVEAISAAGDPVGPVYVADDFWTRCDRFVDRPSVELMDSIEAAATLGPSIICVGYPAPRLAVYDRVVAGSGTEAAPLVHPHASVGVGVALGLASVVMGQTWLSANVRLGRQVHVSYGATIGHDTEIGDFSSVMPGANLGGDVVVGRGVLIGANATVLQGLTIGHGATIGAGSVVTSDVGSGRVMVGVPARPHSPDGRLSAFRVPMERGRHQAGARPAQST